jgi:hypothetical protein
MFRLLSLLVVSTAFVTKAQGPNFSQGGVVLSVQYGPGFWTIDQARLAPEVGVDDAAMFATDAKTSHTATVRARYDILGHASVSADFTGTGWSLDSIDRGGAGFLVGAVTWRPLELLFMNKPRRPIPLDVGTYFGIGYGIAGQRRGMDGLVFEWGLDVDWFLGRYLAVGLFTRGVFFGWNTFYVDYYKREEPGQKIALPRGSGGSFWTLGLTLSFRAGD